MYIYIMSNKILFMSNSFFNRFKKEEEPPIMEEKPPVWEDRIFWVSTLQKIAYPVISNLSKGSLRYEKLFSTYLNLFYQKPLKSL